MSLALSQTLAEIDALNALSESLKQGVDKYIMEARVALEKKAIIYESESDRGFEEPPELTALKEMDIADLNPSEIQRRKKLNELLFHLVKHLGISHLLSYKMKPEFIEIIFDLKQPSVEVREQMLTNRSILCKIELVNRLLKDPKVDPSRDGNEALLSAVHHGLVDTVDRLLQDPRIDPTELNNRVLVLALDRGNRKVLKRLLEDRDASGRLRVDPSVGGLLSHAVRIGQVDMVDLLLQDPRVNPAEASGTIQDVEGLVLDYYQDDDEFLDIRDNYPIRHASRNGHVAVVERLLRERDTSGRLRVDPTACDNQAIQWASERGHVAVVELLKAHGCVLPAHTGEVA